MQANRYTHTHENKRYAHAYLLEAQGKKRRRKKCISHKQGTCTFNTIHTNAVCSKQNTEDRKKKKKKKIHEKHS